MKRIDDVLQASFATKMAVLFKLKGKESFISAVEAIIDRGDLKLVQLMPFTLYGKQIEETVIHVGEIENATPLYVSYNDPVYVRLRDIKNMIKSI